MSIYYYTTGWWNHR